MYDEKQGEWEWEAIHGTFDADRRLGDQEKRSP